MPRGKAALGYSQSLPRDVQLYTEHQLSDMMCMALGGRAAEDIVFNEVSSGAQNDMERVTSMAHSQARREPSAVLHADAQIHPPPDFPSTQTHTLSSNAAAFSPPHPRRTRNPSRPVFPPQPELV